MADVVSHTAAAVDDSSPGRVDQETIFVVSRRRRVTGEVGRCTQVATNCLPRSHIESIESGIYRDPTVH